MNTIEIEVRGRIYKIRELDSENDDDFDIIDDLYRASNNLQRLFRQNKNELANKKSIELTEKYIPLLVVEPELTVEDIGMREILVFKEIMNQLKSAIKSETKKKKS